MIGLDGRTMRSVAERSGWRTTRGNRGKVFVARVCMMIVFGLLVTTLLSTPLPASADFVSRDVTVGAFPTAVAVNPVTNKIYVTNNYSDNVTVIDGTSNTTTTVEAGDAPFVVAVNPETNKIYVANNSSNNVTVIDGTSNTTTTVAAGSDLQAVAVNPVTNKIYVSNTYSHNVTVIDGASNTTTTVATGTFPTAVAVNPVTNKIYVTNSYRGDVTVIDGASNTTTTVAAGVAPNAVAVNPVTNKIYVVNANGNNVTVIDGKSNTTTTVAVGSFPKEVAVNSETNKIYVTNYNSDNVTVIDGTSNTTTTVAAGKGPNAVAVNPETNKIYVANSASDNVTVIDGTSNTTRTVEAGTFPTAVAVNPVTNKIYVTNYFSDNVTVIDGGGDTGSSTISPTVASFDKKASAQADVTTKMTLDGNTLTSIANGVAILAEGTDYTVSAGNTVTIPKVYLAAQPIGTTNLKFTFSDGSTPTLAITVSDTTPQNSTISTASFDKKTTAQADVTATMTLNGNTFTSIANGVTTLVSGTDYTVSGNTVTILKAYLSQQPVGTTSLTFTFSGGSAPTLAITISDSTPTPTPSTISPTNASFDKKAFAQADVATTMTLNGNTLSNIANGATTLTEGADYTVSGNTATILKSYLSKQPIGTTTLKFTFSDGSTPSMAITVSDTTLTPTPSALSPTVASFDKKASAQADVATTMALNGNTLTSIANGATTLTSGTDYSVTDATYGVTILKSYLSKQPVGTTALKFTFSDGSAPTLAIAVSDSTPTSGPITSGPINSGPISPPSGDKSKYEIVEDPSGGITITVDSSILVTETAPGGTVTQKLVLPEEIVNQVSERLKKAVKPILKIKINDKERSVQVQLSAVSIAMLAKSFPNAIIEVELNGSSFQLQVNVLDLESLAKRLGVALKDLKINISMEQVSDSVRKELERIGKIQGFEILGNAVDFKLTAVVNGQKVEIRDFGGKYMARAIVLEGGSKDRNVIAVHYDPATQTVSFIPTQLGSSENGKKEAVMKSLHNSIFAVISPSSRTYADLTGHWARADVELLASKLIVNGISKDLFAPEASITRAEFASLLVRSLALSTERDPQYKGFADVAENAWYAPYVEAAAKAKLVRGMTSDRFAPNERISREEMAVMIARALALASGGEDKQADQQILAKFTDRDSISSWAQAAAAQAVAANMITGMEGRFAPTEFATRAQAAVMLKRLLQAVDFIE